MSFYPPFNMKIVSFAELKFGGNLVGVRMGRRVALESLEQDSNTAIVKLGMLQTHIYHLPVVVTVVLVDTQAYTQAALAFGPPIE